MKGGTVLPMLYPELRLSPEVSAVPRAAEGEGGTGVEHAQESEGIGDKWRFLNLCQLSGSTEQAGARQGIRGETSPCLK